MCHLLARDRWFILTGPAVFKPIWAGQRRECIIHKLKHNSEDFDWSPCPTILMMQKSTSLRFYKQIICSYFTVQKKHIHIPFIWTIISFWCRGLRDLYVFYLNIKDIYLNLYWWHCWKCLQSHCNKKFKHIHNAMCNCIWILKTSTIKSLSSSIHDNYTIFISTLLFVI